MGFDFERMTASFELIQSDFESSGRPLPTTARFVAAMNEVLKLFETLGSAFSFVKRDIESKITIVTTYAASSPAHFADLNAAVAHELAAGTTRSSTNASPTAAVATTTTTKTTKTTAAAALSSLPSCSRTLLRLMWALNFADGLLDGLAMAFDPASDLVASERTLKWAVARAYDAALAEHHSWTIRRAVKSACLLLPSKDAFIDRLGVETGKRDAFLARLGVSMSPLVKRMYAFYDQHDLLALP